jgi:FkbM family methyltransferase
MERVSGLSFEVAGRNMISYAQNFEDVILARVFGAGYKGFYIDAGAGDPTEESVTKHFYDLGWNGINVEPEPLYYERLAADRPRDVNLCVALGEVEETRVFHHTSLRGISTLSKRFRQQFEERCSCVYEEREVTVTTLAQICKQYVTSPIDFLKIDVEGWEGEVLRGGDWNTYRPIIVLLEATEPTPYVPAWDWEPTILGFGYDFVYYDGLNRFYLRSDRQELKHHFQYPPNVHDLIMTYSRAQRDSEMGQLLTSLDEERARSEQLAIRLSGQRVEADELRARCQALAAELSVLQPREADLNEKIRLLNEATERVTRERDNQWARGEQIVCNHVSYRDGVEKLLKGIDQERQRFDQAAKDWQALRQGTDRLVERLTSDRDEERRHAAIQLRVSTWLR